MYSEILMNTMQGHPMSKFKMEFEQVLSIQAEQVNGKNTDIATTTSQFTKAMPENNLIATLNYSSKH
jgi:hypothetical protein